MGSKLEKEYSYLFGLIVRMNALQKNTRPTCEQVLLEKEFWSLSLTDLKNNNEFKSGKMEYSDKVFHSHFIDIKSRSAVD